MDDSEKRAVTRTNYLLTGVVNVENQDSPGYRMIDVTAQDVSADGAYLYTETDFPPDPGQKVSVLLHSAPELKNSTLMFQAKGVVVRVENDLRDYPCGLAVQFEEVPDLGER